MSRQQATGNRQLATGRRFGELLFVIVALLLAPRVLADFDVQRWSHWREIVLPEPGSQNTTDFVLVELDGQVFDRAKVDLSDLRVIDEQGHEIASKPVVVETAFDTDQRRVNPQRLTASFSDQGVDAKRRASVLLVDLGYRHVPSVRLEFDPASNNFRRQIEIEGSNDQQDWQRIGSTEIYDIRIGRVRRQQLSFDYNEEHFRYLRVSIFNYDDQPLKMKDVRVDGWPRRLLFRREAGKRYRLFYGNEKAGAPRYDLEQLSPYLKLDQLPVAMLGDGRANESFSAQSADQTKRDGHPAWLWATLGAAAAMLSILIYRLARMTAGGEAEGEKQ